MKHYYITFTVNVCSEDRYVTATSKYDAVANTPQQAVDSLGKEIKQIFGDEAKLSMIDVFEKIEPLKGEWKPCEEEAST